MIKVCFAFWAWHNLPLDVRAAKAASAQMNNQAEVYAMVKMAKHTFFYFIGNFVPL